MKVTVTVGQVTVRVDGLEFTHRQVRNLIGTVYATAALMAPEEAERNPVGFAAHLERAWEPKPEYQFTDDEEP